MPIILHVDELEPGMRLFQSIMRDLQIILPAGKVLEEWEVNSLRRRFPHLMVRIGDPVLDAMVEFEDDSRQQDVAVAVQRRIGRLMVNVREKLGTQTALDSADVAGLQHAINEVMQYLAENPVSAAMLLHTSEWGSYLQEHSANVFYLSLLMGNAIRDYVFRERGRTTHARNMSLRYGMNLTPLALGCLFHDIGMIPIEHLLSQEEPLGPEDRELIRQHPLTGANMLPEGMDAVARMIVRTHHENYDGSGYPAGIPCEKLHIFSRIIRVADAYDAGTSHRVYRRAKSAARVMWEMSQGPYHALFDPTVTKIMLALIQPFPIGAKVRLEDGTFAVVVRHNRRQPFRPTIVVAFDEHGVRLPKRDLRPPVDLSGTDAIRFREHAGDDLGFLYLGSDPLIDLNNLDLRENSDADVFAFAYP